MSDQHGIRALEQLGEELTRAVAEHPRIAQDWGSRPPADPKRSDRAAHRLRQAVTVSNAMAVIVMAAVILIGGVFVLSLSGSRSALPTRQSARPDSRLPRTQLVAIARATLRGLDDPSVRSARVVETDKNSAENWLEHDAVSPGASDPTAYLIVLSGTFTCDACSHPPGIAAPKGHSAATVWVPGVGANDFGLEPRTPSGLRKLGRVITIQLTAPSVKASQIAIQVGSAIGPVSLTETISRLNKQLGPAISPGDFAIGPIQVLTSTNSSGQITGLGTSSPQATIDGHRLGESYRKLHHALPSWQVLRCTGLGSAGITELTKQAAGEISTRIQFRNDTFDRVYIGHLRPGSCEPPNPAG